MSKYSAETNYKKAKSKVNIMNKENQRNANSAQAQPEKGMRLCAAR